MSVSETDIAEFAAARARVLDRIAAACRRAGREPGSVQLVAVSKTVPAERVVAAVAAGLTLLGENRVQEAASKQPLTPGARWHLIGPLQSNKARTALELFDVIETVDSLDLARRLDRLARDVGGAEEPPAPRAILLQVNADGDPAKAGLRVGELEAALEEVATLDALRVDGLMTIGRLVERPEDARPTFRRLRELSVSLRAHHPGLGSELSMGMSDDFEVAVEEGATIVRVGRALFGDRPPTDRGRAPSIAQPSRPPTR